MSTLFPRTLTSPTLSSSTTLYCISDFCLLLLILLLIISFLVIVSLTIISVVHFIAAMFCLQGIINNDVESGSDIDNLQSPPWSRHCSNIKSFNEAAASQSNRQTIEMLDRVQRAVGEWQRGEERLREAVEKLLPGVCFRSHECVAKECLICSEEFEDED